MPKKLMLSGDDLSERAAVAPPAFRDYHSAFRVRVTSESFAACIARPGWKRSACLARCDTRTTRTATWVFAFLAAARARFLPLPSRAGTETMNNRCAYPPWVVLHVPHDATDIPAWVREQYLLDDSDIEREILRMTDRHARACLGAITCTGGL